jgi:hypothetical protein
MDTVSILVGAIGAAAGAAIGWFAARLRFAQEAEHLRGQLDKVDKARQQATHQWQQARREVDQLQKDMMARGVVAKPVTKAAPADPEADRRTRAAAAEAALREAASEGPPSAMPAHGFADTQPMTSPGRL